MKKSIAVLLLFAILAATGCLSHVAAYRKGWTSPSGLVSISVVGLSGLGQSYSGINDKYADTFVYERQSKSDEFSLAWHEKIPVEAIGDMQVGCTWPEDGVGLLSFYDSRPMQNADSQKHIVTKIRIERDAEGNWDWKKSPNQGIQPTK